MAGDLVYVAGWTRNELGGSEYYGLLGYLGLNVPQVRCAECMVLYRMLHQAIADGRLASVHGVYRGGLGVHLAMVAMGGNLGLAVDARRIPAEGVRRLDTLLFSESAGRFILTVDPGRRREVEAAFEGLPFACVGTVTAESWLKVAGLNGEQAVCAAVSDLKAAWKKPFGQLV
jgi:phosphoribosylformylglycinamidine synthase